MPEADCSLEVYQGIHLTMLEHFIKAVSGMVRRLDKDEQLMANLTELVRQVLSAQDIKLVETMVRDCVKYLKSVTNVGSSVTVD